MAFIKCEIGKPVTLHITDMAEVKGKFGMQVALHAGDDTFQMSPESYKRQFDALGVSDPVGLTFEFSKVDIGGGKTAINVKQVNQPTSGPKKVQPFDQPAVPFQRVQGHGGAPAAQREASGDVYADITDYVLATIVPKYAAKGIALEMGAIAAIVNTNFIQASKR